MTPYQTHSRESRDARRTFDPSFEARGFRVKGLIPRKDPLAASRWAVENLYNVVSEWPQDSLLSIAIMRVGQGIRVYGTVNDLAPSDWFSDLQYALGPIAELKRTNSVPQLPLPVIELLPTSTKTHSEDLDIIDRDLFGADARETGMPTKLGRGAVPIHRSDPLWDLLKVLQTAMTIQISPASDLECQMADASWQNLFDGGSKAEWEQYRGTPIRTRVTLAESSARVLAELKLISQRIEFRRLERGEALELQNLSTTRLIGHTLPKGAACAIWHLPAATLGMRVPGMKVLPPRPRVFPYDRPPVPNPRLRLGQCVNSDGRKQSVFIAPSDLCRHIRVVGSTGSGKSTAMRDMITQAVEEGMGCMVLDPSGALCADLIGDVTDPDRIEYVNFADVQNPIPFNPLAARDEDQFEVRLQAFMNLISDRDSQEYTGPKWRRSFGLVARGCRRLFGDYASLTATFAVLGSQELTKQLYEALRAIDRPLADQIYQELVQVRGDMDLWGWLVAKSEEILGSRPLTQILGAGPNVIDLLNAMDNSKVVLVNLGVAELGERSAQLLGCLLVTEVRLAMLARKERSTPFLLALDEAHLFQYGALPGLLDEARKYGVGVMVCHQRPDQLRSQVKDALASNASSYIQLRTGNLQDAIQASQLLGGWPTEDLTRMRDLHGAAIISREGTPSQAFSIKFNFFKRHASALQDLELREWRAQAVRQGTYQRLVKDHLYLEPITPGNIAEHIREAADPKRRLGPRPRFGPRPSGPVEQQSELPNWLAAKLSEYNAQ